jgi:DNA-binding transcriptional regulator YiaG
MMVPAWICQCGEAYYSSDDVERFEQQSAQWIAMHGFASGKEIGFIRRAVGIRAVDLARLLGVSAETVSHWETGKYPADRATRFAIAGLVLEKLKVETISIEQLLLSLDKPDATKRVKLGIAA